MQRARKKIPLVYEKTMDITEFSGLNTFGPHADLASSEQRLLNNYDNYRGYIKSRRGSAVLVEDLISNDDILEHTVFDAGASEYLLVQQVSGADTQFKFIKLESGSTWDTVKLKGTSTPFTISGSNAKADLFVSNGKVYVYEETQNSILEWNSSLLTFERRKMGLPAPQIQVITEQAGSLSGKRVYGVELVYKDTSVSPEVPIIVSGPNRVKKFASLLPVEGQLAYTTEAEAKSYTIGVSIFLNDGSLLTDAENDNWTHARLWRSKDVTTATNAVIGTDAEIVGREDELFLVQEMDRVSFEATLSSGVYYFAVDDILDDDIPFPLDVVTGDRLELIPIPPGKTGVFLNNRIWVSGVERLNGPNGTYSPPNISSKIFYTPEADTIYSENISPFNAIESDPGDGQKMIKLIPLREDLIGIKEGKTGRVRGANPDLGWSVEDDVVGIETKELAQYVPNVGICAIVNDQNDFRIFGFDLQWRSTFSNMQISRPIREDIKAFTQADIDFIYINGKLIVNGGQGEMLVLASEQKAGWSKYVYPFNSLSEKLFTFDEGRRAAVISRGQPIIEIEKETSGVYVDTDYDVPSGQNLEIDVELDTYKFQDKEGRSLVEERFLSVVASASKVIQATAYVNGKLWQPTFDLLLDPEDYPELALRETEYQGYQEYRAIGNYIHYKLQTKAPCTIYSIMLDCLVQRGSIRPGFDPFEVLSLVQQSPSWTQIYNLYEETGVADELAEETGTATEIIEET